MRDSRVAQEIARWACSKRTSSGRELLEMQRASRLVRLRRFPLSKADSGELIEQGATYRPAGVRAPLFALSTASACRAIIP